MCLRPILTYAASVWSHLIPSGPLESELVFQKRELRIITNRNGITRISELQETRGIEMISDQLYRILFKAPRTKIKKMFYHTSIYQSSKNVLNRLDIVRKKIVQIICIYCNLILSFISDSIHFINILLVNCFALYIFSIMNTNFLTLS